MEVQITITDKLNKSSEYVDIQERQENGVVLNRYKMSLDQLIKALTQSGNDQFIYATPFLPKNCIFLSHTTHGYEVFIDLPKKKWQIEYKGERHLVGFPRLVLNYSLYKNTIHSFKIAAVKENGNINSDTEIYYFPYSNVEQNTGEVCMGLNTFPEVNSLHQLEGMHHLFFSAPFGEDYGARAIGKSLADLFKLFKDKEFDDELLIPSKRSLKDFFKI